MVPKYKLGKTARLVLRLMPEQKLLIVARAQAANKTINEFCTDIIMNFKYVDQLQRIEEKQKKRLALLQNIANNINQLAAHCNTVDTAPQKTLLIELLKQVSKNANI